MRGAARWLLLMITALALAGCAGLPSGSGVRAGVPVDNTSAPTQVEVNYPGPQPGARPQDIVSGFLAANAGLDQDYQKAREFLTTSASKDWDPTTVSIYSGSRPIAVTAAGTSTVVATIRRTATLDATGHLTQEAGAEPYSAQFGLTKVGGQWRISSIPNGFGTFINATDFTGRLYQPETVFYAAATGHTLVPDTQWFPTTGLVTALATAILRGPPSWMSGMAMAPLPSGTRLQVASVPIDNNGVATVDLTEDALRASSTQRSGLWASMIATLAQVTSVQRVNVVVDGVRLAATGLPQTPLEPSDVGYQIDPGGATTVIARTSATALQWVDPVTGSAGSLNEHVTPNAGLPALPVVSQNWYHFAAIFGGTQLAAVSGSNSQLGRWVNGKLTILPSFGTALVKPSFGTIQTSDSGSLTELWVAGITGAGSAPRRPPGGTAAVWVINTSQPVATAGPQRITVPWLDGGTILALKVAPDGTRVAMVVRDRNGISHTYLSAITRNPKTDSAQSLGAPLTVATDITGVTDVTWVNGTTLAVLGADPTSGVIEPEQIQIGQFSSSLNIARGAMSIMATGGDGAFYVTTNQNTVLTRVGAQWQPFGEARDVIVPGT